MLFGQSEFKNSEPFHAIVSAYIFKDEKGNTEIEIFDFIHNDDNGSEIFCDIEYILRDYLEFGDKEEHYFMAHVKSWFHTYHDYFDGYQCEVESEVSELKTINDFAKIKFD
jgi:hypothetical protein